jgi:hypothetical protein
VLEHQPSCGPCRTSGTHVDWWSALIIVHRRCRHLRRPYLCLCLSGRLRRPCLRLRLSGRPCLSRRHLCLLRPVIMNNNRNKIWWNSPNSPQCLHSDLVAPGTWKKLLVIGDRRLWRGGSERILMSPRGGWIGESWKSPLKTILSVKPEYSGLFSVVSGKSGISREISGISKLAPVQRNMYTAQNRCHRVCLAVTVTTPPEIILYYRLNHSSRSLSDNK